MLPAPSPRSLRPWPMPDGPSKSRLQYRVSRLQAQEMHATEGAVEVRRARRRLEDTVTDERVGLFTPDKDGDTHTSCGRVAVLAARRGTVCGEVGRVPRFRSTQHPHPLLPTPRELSRDLELRRERCSLLRRKDVRWRCRCGWSEREIFSNTKQLLCSGL